jgi:hypothetical protein
LSRGSNKQRSIRKKRPRYREKKKLNQNQSEAVNGSIQTDKNMVSPVSILIIRFSKKKRPFLYDLLASKATNIGEAKSLVPSETAIISQTLFTSKRPPEYAFLRIGSHRLVLNIGALEA